MRHLSLDDNDPCPLDERPARRSVCQHCPFFVSYRLVEGSDGLRRATVGCAQGADVGAWLRSQFEQDERKAA
jgi:hypothetical protein